MRTHDEWFEILGHQADGIDESRRRILRMEADGRDALMERQMLDARSSTYRATLAHLPLEILCQWAHERGASYAV